MRRKMTSMAIIVSLLAAAFGMTACGSSNAKSESEVSAGTESTAVSGKESSGNYSVNKEYNNDSMITLSGAKADMSDYEILNTTGVAVLIPDAWNNLNNEYGLNIESGDPYYFMVYYIPEEHVNKIMGMTEDADDSEIEEIYSAASDAIIPICSFGRVNPDDSESQYYADNMNEYFSGTEELCTIGEDTFYFSSNITFSQDGLSENDIADVQSIIGALAELKGNLAVFPPVESAMDLTSFTATDMDGNTIDASIFADYDVTMINIWATWCQYCVEEMPSIEALYENKADNVNIITICQDAADEPELAASELEQVGATFTTLQGNDELEEKVIANIEGFPTTIFVNSKGQIIGSTQVGAPASEDSAIQAAYQELIEEALAEAN